MRKFYSIFLIHVLFGQVHVGDWSAYTSPLEIADLVEVDSLLVSATNGGLLVYDRVQDEFNTVTKIHGLNGTDLSTVNIDTYNQYWIGGASPDGFIQILDEQFSVLESFDYDLTFIVDFAIADSIVFAAFQQNQDWGIMEFRFDGKQYFYKDVYTNWPVTLNEISGLVLSGEMLYVGTDQGMFSGNWKSNLKDPTNWQPNDELTGLISIFRQNGDNILLLMENDIYEFNTQINSSSLVWDHYHDYHDSHELVDILQDEDGGIWGLLIKNFLKMNSTAIAWSERPGERFKRIFNLSDGTKVAGTTTGLLFLDENSRTFTRQKPNSLLMNNVSALHVLSDGRLVAGSKFGLMIKEEKGWRNIVGINGDDLIISSNKDYSRFVADTIPVHFGNYITDIEEGSDGLLYCGVRGTYPEPRMHGGGIVVIDVDNPENFTLIDTNHLDYFYDNYLIVKDIAKDPYGNLWIADTYATTNFEPLKVLTPDHAWGVFNVIGSGGALSLTPNSIDLDSWGRIWIGSFEDGNNVGGASNGGIAMLDYTGNPVNPDETEWTNVNAISDASTNSVWSLGVNSNDVLYVLTPKGLNGLTLQYSNSNPVAFYGFTYFPNISFSLGSKLRIDHRDNIWVTSPTQGVYVLTSSASYWPDINGLTAENSYLLSNNINSVAFDGKGLAYIATDKGISVLKIPFAKVNTSYSNLDIFPSPYRVPTVTPLTIDGLMDESSCKIMTLTGRVLKTIESRPNVEGYQAFWDGRDEAGDWVSTGVYLIAVYDKKGASSISKIAVIRN
mgnify:CR=1 FL=1